MPPHSERAVETPEVGVLPPEFLADDDPIVNRAVEIPEEPAAEAPAVVPPVVPVPIAGADRRAGAGRTRLRGRSTTSPPPPARPR